MFHWLSQNWLTITIVIAAYLGGYLRGSYKEFMESYELRNMLRGCAEVFRNIAVGFKVEPKTLLEDASKISKFLKDED